jgi:hypothetical protein
VEPRPAESSTPEAALEAASSAAQQLVRDAEEDQSRVAGADPRQTVDLLLSFIQTHDALTSRRDLLRDELRAIDEQLRAFEGRIARIPALLSSEAG